MHNGIHQIVYTWQIETPLGSVTVTSDGVSLTGLCFDAPDSAPNAHVFCEPLSVFEQTQRWLSIYFSGREPDFTPPLSLRGTPFQTAVWETVQTVPYGETAAYGALAKRLSKSAGNPRAFARAVGGALARNPVLLIVPCHRIVAADGALTGYAGGTERKRLLLALERDGRERGR